MQPLTLIFVSPAFIEHYEHNGSYKEGKKM